MIPRPRIAAPQTGNRYHVSLRRPHAASGAPLHRRPRRILRPDADRWPADRLHAGAGIRRRALSGQSEPRRNSGAEGLSLGRRSAGNAGRGDRCGAGRARRAGDRGPGQARHQSRGDVHRRLRRNGRRRRRRAGQHGRDRARARHAHPRAQLPGRVRRPPIVLRNVLVVVRQRLAGAGAHRHRQPVRRLRHASLHPGAQPRHRRVALHHDRQRGRRDGRRMHRLAGGKPRSRRHRRLRRGHSRSARPDRRVRGGAGREEADRDAEGRAAANSAARRRSRTPPRSPATMR